jgi:release factor glutamine methyltransferase
LGELVVWGADLLASSSESPRLDAELLLAHVEKIQRSTILAFPERPVGADERRAFEELVARRGNGVPTAYLVGKREFYSLRFEIGPAVLVPRPETELVVDTALELLADSSSAEVLDLGTGSGAIALAIKHGRPNVRMTAVDSSAAALAIARNNAAALDLEVEFLLSDWFEAVEGRRFGLIVANPPYVASADPALSGALRHEPAVALDGGQDGLDAIRAIVVAVSHYLSPGAAVIVEHGDEQGAAVRALALASGFATVRTLKDLAGRDRAMLAVLV